MAKFRKKPVIVEAEQFQPTKEPWPAGVRETGAEGAPGMEPIRHFGIDTLEGPLVVTPGDWIITGVKGELYPCKPDIFEMTYEPVE